MHAVIVRSTFPSQNIQNEHNTPASNHFWKLRCRKSVRRYSAIHISKSKVLKIDGLGPLFEVQMSKKYTTLWREAHFEVKILKTLGFRPLLQVQIYFPSLHLITVYYITLHCTTLHYTTLHNNTTTTTQLHSTTLHYTKLHSTTLHYTTLHCTTLHSTTLHYTTLHYNYTTTLHYTPLH